MTVFKTYLKILRKNLIMVLVFSIMLVIFGGLRMSSQDKSLSFNAVKPDVLIVNKDEEKGITKGFIKYIKSNSNNPKVDNNEDARNDALFYNEVDYIIYIPKGFNEDFMNGKIDKIKVKKGNNFNGSYSEMMINRYLKVATTYRNKTNDQDELVKIVDKIGPIRVYSDESFISGIYDPGVKKEYRYYKGWNTLNGEEALSFARERHAFDDGDRVRGKHQQVLIEAILKKITSPSIIINYPSLLDALSQTFITNLEDENLKKMIKLQIDENIDWQIEKYVLNGDNGFDYTYSYPKQKSYVMIPKEDSLNEAKDLIKKTYNGESNA